MTDIRSPIECCECGVALNAANDTPDGQAPCPNCGSSLRNFNVSIVENSVARDFMGVKVRPNEKQKPNFWSTSKPDFSRDLQKAVHRENSFDRVNDLYEEKITDLETGEILKHVSEKLTEHRGHGAAKPKLPPTKG